MPGTLFAGWLVTLSSDPRESLVPIARAATSNGSDADLDGLPDELEILFGTQPFLGDTDADNYSDGMEWVLRTDPTDATSTPVLRAALRAYAYEGPSGDPCIFVALWPGNLAFLQKFSGWLASPAFDAAPEGDSQLGLLDITRPMIDAVDDLSLVQSQGLQLVGFSFELPASLLSRYQPLSLGLAARIAGVPLVEQLSLATIGSTPMVFLPDPSVLPGTTPPPAYWFLPLDPGGGGSDPEYCQTTLGPGDPTGGGGILYQVQSANCVPDGLLYCVAQDCASLAGQSLTLIDYGFLQSKAN
ncbi:MAG TPA: hypothetical protein VFP98_05620 [Candidatus Polarisedimenticolia bacterium]|nr:hypothetical protein [Candidatus Polarisedimenticolia bacterium]